MADNAPFARVIGGIVSSINHSASDAGKTQFMVIAADSSRAEPWLVMWIMLLTLLIQKAGQQSRQRASARRRQNFVRHNRRFQPHGERRQQSHVFNFIWIIV